MKRNQAIVPRLRIGLIIALPAVVVLAMGCSKDSTKPVDRTPSGLVRVEAEAFVGSHDGGGAGITTPSCTGASGQVAVEGIDFDGDWIEIPFALSQATCFSDSLRGEGLLGDVRRFAILFYQNGGQVAADTLDTDPGKGFG